MPFQGELERRNDLATFATMLHGAPARKLRDQAMAQLVPTLSERLRG